MSMVVSKALRLIDFVAEGTDTLADIAAASEMSRSTTHRLLATLVEHNYLVYEARKYRLGYRLLELGEKKKRSLDFLDTLRPILVRYAEMTRDTIHLAVLDGNDIVLIDRVFGDRQLRVNSFPGLRNTAFMTAVGKVLIAHLPPKQWPDFIQKIPAAYPRTTEQVLAELKEARRTNTAIDIDECNIGTCGVASSFSVNENVRVACSINGATVYFGNNRLEDLKPVVQRMAAELENATLDQLSGVNLNNNRDSPNL